MVARKSEAISMRLRPNPTMFLHQMMAARFVLHLDTFAYWREGKPDHILIELQERAGGRAPLIRSHYWLAEIGIDAAPVHTDGKVAQYYDPLDTVRFNTPSGRRWHDWALAMHHRYWRELVTERQLTKPYKAKSVMFHYWHAYDLNPLVGFSNWKVRDTDQVIT